MSIKGKVRVLGPCCGGEWISIVVNSHVVEAADPLERGECCRQRMWSGPTVPKTEKKGCRGRNAATLAEKEDLKPVLRLQGRQEAQAGDPGQGCSPARAAGLLTHRLRDQARCRFQVVWTQPEGSTGIGGGPVAVSVGCYRSLLSFQRNGRPSLSRCDVPGTVWGTWSIRAYTC